MALLLLLLLAPGCDSGNEPPPVPVPDPGPEGCPVEIGDVMRPLWFPVPVAPSGTRDIPYTAIIEDCTVASNEFADRMATLTLECPDYEEGSPVTVIFGASQRPALALGNEVQLSIAFASFFEGPRIEVIRVEDFAAGVAVVAVDHSGPASIESVEDVVQSDLGPELTQLAPWLECPIAHAPDSVITYYAAELGIGLWASPDRPNESSGGSWVNYQLGAERSRVAGGVEWSELVVTYQVVE